MKRREFNQLMAAAVAGLVAGASALPARAQQDKEKSDDRSGCSGKDGCGGKSDDKSGCSGKDGCGGKSDGKGSCAGKDDCSGKSDQKASCSGKDGCCGKDCKDGCPSKGPK